jgi:dihydroorotate dehydrogenase (fumarate)
MTDLTTSYLGLQLDNPLVPSASPLTGNLDYARQLEDAGAAALVMQSLFEEDLREEEEHLAKYGVEQDIGHHEAAHFLPTHHEVSTTLERYLDHLDKLKSSLAIPVIASLNGTSISHWLDHARDLQQAGADALELNMYYVVADVDETPVTIEQRYESIVRELVSTVSIPITVKLSPYFSALPNFVRRLSNAGASGVVLFNRFYQPNIDLEELQVDYRLILSNPGDSLLAMRWIALLYGRVDVSLAATGGIHSAIDALKVISAGASVAHLCSTLLTLGPRQLTHIKSQMVEWLVEHEYESISQLTGSISQQHAPDPASYERHNYTKTLNSYQLSTKHWR